MAHTLTTMIAAVESDLKDTGNAIWSDEELTRAIRRALYDLSRVKPLRAVATMDDADGSREYDLSTLSGLLDVIEVWWPYDADDPSYPPARVAWRMLDGHTLYLDTADEPDGTSQMRIFYTRLQTINGLDGEESTSLNPDEEEMVILGATAYAALSKGVDVIGTVTASEATPAQWESWGRARLTSSAR